MLKKYFETINECRICFSREFKEILNLGEQPPANSIYNENNPSPNPVPLRLMFCQKCHTVQLGETVDPSYLFDKYVTLLQCLNPVCRLLPQTHTTKHF